MSEPNAESVRVVNGGFGRVVQLWRGDVLVDTYCAWNGDPRPDWLPQSEGDDRGTRSV